MLRKGIDAKSEQQKQRAELQQKQADTFAHVADALIKEHLSKGKKGGDQLIRREFVKRWASRPVTEIRREECAAAIEAITGRGHAPTAHNALAQCVSCSRGQSRNIALV
jgi:hypothetical protein